MGAGAPRWRIAPKVPTPALFLNTFAARRKNGRPRSAKPTTPARTIADHIEDRALVE
jgi:hypothetical protein